MKRALIAAAIALPVSQLALADTYQFQVDGAYSRVEISDFDTDIIGAGGTYYFFDGVDDSKGPLAQAAFLDKSTSISFAYATSEEDDGGVDADIDVFGLSGRYVHKESGFIFEADIMTSELDTQGETFNEDTASVSIGAYLDDVTTALISYSASDDDSGLDTESIAIAYKRVHTFKNGTVVNSEANISYTDVDEGGDGTMFTYLADYYINNNLSVGGLLGFLDSDGDDAYIYGARTEYFFNNKLSVMASIDRTDFDDFDIEIDTLTIGISGRF